MIAKKNKKVKTLIAEFKRRVIFGILLFSVIFLLYTNIKIMEERKRAEKELEKIEAQIETKEKEKDRYNFELGKSDTEEYLEEIAREELGLQKEGEQIIIIKKQGDTESTEQIENRSFIDKVINWFKELLPE
ncbi:MAG TPA: septum formation initiator family protein [Candidatus Pacearchaeota archaeon]|nr:septum formation initiator family protein [Candidatus Pacearchaeota archaeon]